MIKKIPLRLNVYFLLTLLLIFSAGLSNFLLLRHDNYITGTDSQNHLLFSVDFFYCAQDLWQNKAISFFGRVSDMIRLLGHPLYGDVYWPNGLNFTASFFYFFFGRSLLSAKMSLLPYLLILLFSTYLIGKTIFSGFVGFLASFLLFMLPIIFMSSRQFQLDFPLTAMVTLSILCLLKSDNFRSRKYSFLLGLCLGWTMLIKGQAMLFFACPLLIVLYKVFISYFRGAFKKSQLQNIGIFVLVSGLIAYIWWGHQIKAIENSLFEHIFSAQKALEANFTWDKKYSFEAVSYNLRELFKSSGPISFLSFIVFFAIFVRAKIKHKDLILGWLIVPLFLFSLVFTVKHYRFLMPLMPPISLVTACGLAQIKSKLYRTSVSLAIIIFALIQFYLLTWAPLRYREVSLSGLKIFGRLGADTAYEAPPPHEDDLKIEEVAKFINERFRLRGEPIRIGSISCGNRPGTLETIYLLKLKAKDFQAIDLTEMSRLFLDNFHKMDIILFQQPSEGQIQWPGGLEFRSLLEEKHSARIRVLEQPNVVGHWENLLKALEDSQDDFRLLGKVPKNDGTIFYIYERISG